MELRIPTSWACCEDSIWYSKRLTLHSAWDIADAQPLDGLFLAALHWRSVSGRAVFCTGIVLEGLLMPCTPGSCEAIDDYDSRRGFL